MHRIGFAFVLCLAVATVANAGALFDLAPTTAGPWMEGDTISFQLNLVNNTTFDWATVRGVQISNLDNPCGLTYGDISWTSFTTGIPSFQYQAVGNWVGGVSAVAFTGTVTNPMTSVGALVGGSIDCGTFDLSGFTFDPGCDPEVYWATTLPAEACDYCVVDILNFGGTNPDFIGRINLNFASDGLPYGDWNVFDNPDMFEGGIGYLYVLPEPASLGLLGLGMLVVLRRRR